MTAILLLISEADRWRIEHKRAGRQIEAAACAIRIKALKDALEALKGGDAA